jgi:hypothetical protein
MKNIKKANLKFTTKLLGQVGLTFMENILPIVQILDYLDFTNYIIKIIDLEGFLYGMVILFT